MMPVPRDFDFDKAARRQSAAMMMQGLLSGMTVHRVNPPSNEQLQAIARAAVAAADALTAELERSEK